MRVKFVEDYPIEDSLTFEDCYPENLQLEAEDKEWLKEHGATFIYMVDADSGIAIAETYYIPLDALQEEEPDELQGYDGLDDYYGLNAIYVYSTTVLPAYQGYGYAKMLKAYMYGVLKSSGYSMVLGHARKSTGSIDLNMLFGAEPLGQFDNWFQTGESYVLYKTDL